MHVLIVDDHPIVRRGLVQLMLDRPNVSSCGEACSVDGALAECGRQRPDVIVLDLSLQDESGLELVRRLRASGDTTPILVLSMYDETMHAERALRTGAQGFMMKASAAEVVADAVDRAARGERVLSPAMHARFDAPGAAAATAIDPVAALTSRELEVLRLIGEGHSTAGIADRQCRSVKTIESHRESIKRKLALRSATELVRYATLWREHG